MHNRVRAIAIVAALGMASLASGNAAASTSAPMASLSRHAWGTAIDINPEENPSVAGSTVDPPQGSSWLARSSVVPGMILHGGPVTAELVGTLGWGCRGLRWVSSPSSRSVGLSAWRWR